MKTHFLLPNSLKALGWLLFIPALLTASVFYFGNIDLGSQWNVTTFAILDNGFLTKESGYFRFIQNGILDEVVLCSLIIGGILVGFCKLKHEDELTQMIRYESLVWATYFNFGLMLFATVFIFGTSYFDVMLANLFTMLLFFICRFHYKLYQLRKSAADEE